MIKIRGALFLILAVITGCVNSSDPSYAWSKSRIAVEVAIRPTKESLVEYARVKDDCSEQACKATEVVIGTRRIKLLGFAPYFGKVQHDVRLNATWVLLHNGMRHPSCYLVLRVQHDEIHGIVLLDQEPTLYPSSVCFDDLNVQYESKWTLIGSQNVVVDRDFVQAVLKPHRQVPGGAITLQEIEYSRDVVLRRGS